ncbi:MAG: hypothetical protein K0S09_1296 [Sphingobacteriaceae bacterium]|jgi:hypothetical protein|nr:hypothetical protein [Sphingobacteriaceae bacterium]
MIKKVACLIWITCFWLSLNAQTKVPEKFYKSFNRYLAARNTDSLNNRATYIHSVLIKTNDQGEIVLLRQSAGNEQIKNNLLYVFKNLDKQSLTGFGLENKTLLLPIIYVRTVPPDNMQSGYNQNNIWTFDNESFPKAEVLSPLIIFFDNRKGGGIVN